MKNINKKFFSFLIITLVITIQSCQTEDNYFSDKNEDFNNQKLELENTIVDSGEELSYIFNQQNALKKSKNIRLKATENLQLEETAKQTLIPLIESSKKLLSVYGIEDDFLQDEFKDENDPRIALAGILILAAEKDFRLAGSISPKFNTNDFSLSQLISLNVANAEWDTDTVMNCLGAALGVHEIIGLIENTAQLATAQGVKKVVKLIARRYVGWIGVGVAVYSFGNCMEAW